MLSPSPTQGPESPLDPRPMTSRDALINFLIWVAVAAVVDVAILIFWGPKLAMEFFGAWAMEETLSLDNLFMFYFIFATFETPHLARPRVLHWGILGVIAMRGAIILAGTAVIARSKPSTLT